MHRVNVNYVLKRSKRKTVAIHITREAMVEVRAPFHVPKAVIDSFINEKEPWIAKHLAIKERLNSEKAHFAVVYGDMILFQGKEYPVKDREGNRTGFDGVCFYLPPNLTATKIKDTLIQIYKGLSKKTLRQKTEYFAKHMNVSPSAVKVGNAKTHWGSCSNSNSINFSWRLIMADEQTIDYVIVHELAHIKEHNHSLRFWSIVEAVLPDYKERQKTLRGLQERLSKEDW